jgi:hypothetical protein
MNCATFAEMAVLIRNYFYYKKRGGGKKRIKKSKKFGVNKPQFSQR